MAGPLKQFEIKSLTEEPLMLFGVDVSFTNSALWMMIAVVVAVIIFGLATRTKHMVPTRMQLIGELFYEFISGMIKENVGPEGRKYFALIFTTFMIVLLGNLLGMIPGSFTYTSHIAVTLFLALALFVLTTLIGFARHGLKFFSFFCPSGVPLALTPLIIPIEILSYLIRPITLSVRLFANMMAGHLILKVFAGFVVSMFGMGIIGVAMGMVPLLFNSILIGFEILIALIHAYVFTVLTCLYLKDSIDLH